MKGFSRICLLMVVLLCLGGCLGPLKIGGGDKPLMWRLDADGVYRYEDQDLAVTFQPTADRQFLWSFRNKAFLPMSIDQNNLALFREGDPYIYTLWGERVEKTRENAFISVAPGGFVRQGYPVRFTSPFNPFRVGEAGVYLQMSVTWGRKAYTYQLIFPRDPEPLDDNL